MTDLQDAIALLQDSELVRLLAECPEVVYYTPEGKDGAHIERLIKGGYLEHISQNNRHAYRAGTLGTALLTVLTAAAKVPALEARAVLAEARLAALDDASNEWWTDALDINLYDKPLTIHELSDALLAAARGVRALGCRVEDLPERAGQEGSAAGVRGLRLDAPTSYGDALDKAKAAGADVSAPTRRKEGSKP